MNDAPTYLLRVQGADFRSGAIWKKIKGIWCCSRTSPRLRWMIGQSNHVVKEALSQMGAKFAWKPLVQRADGTVKVKR